MITLDEILKEDPKQRSTNSITRVYRGRDHACRCGCCGNYYEKGEKGFTRAYNQLKKGVECVEKIEYGTNYINVPYDYDRDYCLCIYFD